MQLSISIPTPAAPDPAPPQASLANLVGDSKGSNDTQQDSFSDLLQKPTSDSAGQDSQSQSKSAKPTKAQQDAAAALSASMMATLQQHLAPTVAVSLVPAGGTGISAAKGNATTDVATSAVASASNAAAPVAAELPAVAASLGARSKQAAPSPAQATAASAKSASLSPSADLSPPADPAATSPAAVAARTLPGPAALPTSEQTVRAAAAGGEKIAATSVKSPAGVPAAGTAASKKILVNGDKQVTDSSDSVGTPVAKVGPVMPTQTNPERATSSQPAFQVASVSAPSSGSSNSQPAAEAQVTGTAKGAVEAAMTAAEMLTSGATQNSMNMQFAMGDAQLNLRVEMRNGEVQATFSTNSAQLRSDLAHVWQTTAAGDSQSSLHQIQPVFTSSGTGSTLSSGEYAQQQGRGQDGGAEPRFSTSGGSSSSSSFTSSHEEEPELAAPAAAAAGSQYLQTFA